MMKTFRELEPGMLEVAKTSSGRYKEAEAAEAATRDAVRIWMMIAFALYRRPGVRLSLLIGRSISKALAAMVAAMTRLAGGELTIAIPGLGRKDEIGEMAGAVEVFKDNMIETDRLRAEQVEAEQRQARAAQGGHAASSPISSKARSARSSRPCRRPRPSSRPPPTR